MNPCEHMDGLDADLANAADEIDSLRQQLETERMRLAACGCAALGYFNGCADEYKSASLDDVLALHQRVVELEHAIDDKMVVAHIGTFEKDDDPTEAVCKLMNYAQSLGEYFIKDKLATCQSQLKETRTNDLHSMRYLSEIRGMVGGDDYPDMIARIAELVRSEK
jgi:hypothetical protein